MVNFRACRTILFRHGTYSLITAADYIITGGVYIISGGDYIISDENYKNRYARNGFYIMGKETIYQGKENYFSRDESDYCFLLRIFAPFLKLKGSV